MTTSCSRRAGALGGCVTCRGDGHHRRIGRRDLRGRQARRARAGRRSSSAVKDAALDAIADALIEATDEILSANARDLEAGESSGLAEALIDRLTLTSRADRRRSPPACGRSRRCPIPSAR